MKKLLLVALITLSGILGANAQKAKYNIEDTQARLLDVQSNSYVKPLTVELKVIDLKTLQSIDSNVDPVTGRVTAEWLITSAQVDDMKGELSNIRSWGVYKTSQKFNADVIVAATFNFKNEEGKPDLFRLTVVGYPANFVNWKTATPDDYEWIRMEKVQTTSDREKISAIIK